MEQDQTRRDEPGFCISHGSDRLFGVVGFELGLPVKYLGVGEKADDLVPMDARAFVDALLPRAA